MANDINGPLRNVLPGNIDDWNKVYATVAAANTAIPNTVVGGKSFRLGKVVQIGTETDFIEHHWFGGFENVNLVPKVPDLSKSKVIFNATVEVPLQSGYYTFNTAVRAVPTSVIKKGLILIFESSDKKWETLEFKGEIADFLNNRLWLSIDAGSYFGAERASIPTTYRKKGLISTYFKDGSYLVEQYIGDEFLSTDALFSNNSNWLRLATYADYTSLRDSKAVFNVTSEVPLSSGYYTFSTACRAVPVSVRKRGLILTYEVADKVWETIAFKGDVTANWVDSTYWISIDEPAIIGLKRTDIPKSKRKKGIIASYQENNAWVIEQYIGENFVSDSVFFQSANWLRVNSSGGGDNGLEPKILTNRAHVSSLEASLLSDTSYLNVSNGLIDAATGVIVNLTDTTKLITPELIPVQNIERINVATGYSFHCIEFSASGTFLAATAAYTSNKTTFNTATRYIRLMIRITAGGALPPANFSLTGLNIETRLKSPYRDQYIKDRNQNLTLKDATVISNWKVEKMAHCSTIHEDLFSPEGNLWASYYCSETSYIENASAQNIYCVLAKINPCDFSETVRYKALIPGEVVGDYKAGNISPYDPALIVKDANTIQYIMVSGNSNDSFGVRYVSRNFDKTTNTFANSIQQLQIRYTANSVTYTELMNVTNLSTMIDRLFNRTNSFAGTYPIFSGRIDKANGFYWVYLGGLVTDGRGFQGGILKSLDGLIWEYVSSPPLAFNSLWEGALKVIGQKVFVFVKGNNRYNFFIYDLTTSTWIAEKELTGQVVSRPFLWYYNNKLYAMYNAPSNTTTWGTVYRSTLGISVIDQNTLDILDTQLVKTDAGCHYMSACEYKGTGYFMFTEDRRKYDINQMKGNISIIDMRFLKV